MNTSDIILFLSVFVTVLHSAASLKCYVCNSGEDDVCGDKDFGLMDYVQECRAEETACMMQTTQNYIRVDGKQIKGTVLTTRYCGEEDWIGCFEKMGAKSVTTQCSCKDNRCNSAPSIHAPASAALVLGSTVILLVAWMRP